MNSYLNSNMALFSARFPALYNAHRDIFLNAPQTALPPGCELIETRSGNATVSENGLLYHSRYNPVHEAAKLVSAAPDEPAHTPHTAGVFLAFGLGYAVIEYAKQYPGNKIIVIEPDISRLIPAFTYTDWTPVFSHQNIVFLVGAEQQTVIAILEKTGIDMCSFFSVPAQTAHAAAWFAALSELIERNRRKKNINDHTLEKFSRLWIRNTCINSRAYTQFPGITTLKGIADGMNACIVAAGPSLDRILPVLGDIQKHAVLICVDTALRACLAAGIQPDILILSDPQYWNARHITGLAAPESIFVTEIAAYPAVFRFPCRHIYLYASHYPVGKYIETQFEKNGVPSYGSLGAGGSVASTAWDLARFIGCTRIYTAGLDLGFPGKQTHTRGSTFETTALSTATRIIPAETANVHALLNAYPYYQKDYNGHDILTDRRMSLYAWWFESKCAEYPEIRTYTLTPESLCIPGVSIATVAEVLDSPERNGTLKDTPGFETTPEAEVPGAAPVPAAVSEELYAGVMRTLCDGLQRLQTIAEQAQQLCVSALEHTAGDPEKNSGSQAGTPPEILNTLAAHDAMILSSDCRDIASLVFPTRRQLEKAYADLPQEETPFRKNILQSKIVYEKLTDAVQFTLKKLQKNTTPHSSSLHTYRY